MCAPHPWTGSSGAAPTGVAYGELLSERAVQLRTPDSHCLPWRDVGLGGDGEGPHSPPPGTRSGPHWLSDTQPNFSASLCRETGAGRTHHPAGSGGGVLEGGRSHAAPGAGPWASAYTLNPTPPPTTLCCSDLWAEALHLVFRDDHLGDDDEDRGALGRRRERENATVPV